jgi:hypothetical protein
VNLARGRKKELEGKLGGEVGRGKRGENRKKNGKERRKRQKG